MLELQRAAGNRAVARLVGHGVVQRHPSPSANAEVQDGDATVVADEGTVPAVAENAESQAAPSTDGSSSQPGTGTTGSTGITGSTPTGLKGEARHKAIYDTLGASATGMWAQRIITKWKVPIDYEFGGQGSYHQGGKIYLNKALGVGGAAMVLMHEAQHADTFKSGKQADRTKLGRAEYVQQSIADEAEAVVRQIEGLAVTTSLAATCQGPASTTPTSSAT